MNEKFSDEKIMLFVAGELSSHEQEKIRKEAKTNTELANKIKYMRDFDELFDKDAEILDIGDEEND